MNCKYISCKNAPKLVEEGLKNFFFYATVSLLNDGHEIKIDCHRISIYYPGQQVIFLGQK